MSYPKWLYSRTEEPFIVADEAAHKALKGQWFESPADIPGKSEPKTLGDLLEKGFGSETAAPKPKKGK